MDLFDKLANKTSPLGQFADEAHHYYTFPKLDRHPIGLCAMRAIRLQ